MNKKLKNHPDNLSANDLTITLPQVKKILNECRGKKNALSMSQLLYNLRLKKVYTSRRKVREVVDVLQDTALVSRLIITHEGYYRGTATQFGEYLDKMESRAARMIERVNLLSSQE